METDAKVTKASIIKVMQRARNDVRRNHPDPHLWIAFVVLGD